MLESSCLVTSTREEDVFGPYGHGAEAAHRVEVPNRDLLFEFCTAYDYTVANMLQWTPASQKETFAGPVTAGARPCSAMLDLLSVPQAAVGDVVIVLSLKEAPLASDHYL